MSTVIFTLTMNNIFIQAPKLLREVANIYLRLCLPLILMACFTSQKKEKQVSWKCNHVRPIYNLNWEFENLLNLPYVAILVPLIIQCPWLQLVLDALACPQSPPAIDGMVQLITLFINYGDHMSISMAQIVVVPRLKRYHSDTKPTLYPQQQDASKVTSNFFSLFLFLNHYIG